MLTLTETASLLLGTSLAISEPLKNRDFKETAVNLIGSLGLGLGLLGLYGNNGLFTAVLPILLYVAGVLSYRDAKLEALPERLPSIAIAVTLVADAVVWHDWKGSFLTPSPINSFSLVVAFFVIIREFSFLILKREGLGDADSPVAGLYFSLFPFPYSFYAIAFTTVFALIYLAFKRRAYTPLIPFFLLGSGLTGAWIFSLNL